MFIATSRGERQAPLGAACCPATPSPELPLPLLTELENYHLGRFGYRHDAPNGAVPLAHECLMLNLCGLSWGGKHLKRITSRGTNSHPAEARC
jgi:hypothetical protein